MNLRAVLQGDGTGWSTPCAWNWKTRRASCPAAAAHCPRLRRAATLRAANAALTAGVGAYGCPINAFAAYSSRSVTWNIVSPRAALSQVRSRVDDLRNPRSDGPRAGRVLPATKMSA